MEGGREEVREEHGGADGTSVNRWLSGSRGLTEFIFHNEAGSGRTLALRTTSSRTGKDMQCADLGEICNCFGFKDFLLFTKSGVLGPKKCSHKAQTPPSRSLGWVN